MTRAVGMLGMFGSDAAAKRLHAKLRSERVYIERHNFRHPDDMLAQVYEEPDIAAVLLVEKALKELDPNVTVTLAYLRSSDRTVRIIFIKDEPERDYEFELWCYERGIYDVAYPSRHTDVNIDAIRDAVLQGRIDPDNPPPPPPEPKAEPEQTERVKLRDRISVPSMPSIKLPEWNNPSLFEFIRKPGQEQPGKPPFKLTFFKQNEDGQLHVYYVSVVHRDMEFFISQQAESVHTGKNSTVIFILDELAQSDAIRFPYKHYFAVTEKGRIAFYEGGD